MEHGGVSVATNSWSQRSQEQLINLITRGVATCTFQTELISSIFKSVAESILRLRVYIYKVCIILSFVSV